MNNILNIAHQEDVQFSIKLRNLCPEYNNKEPFSESIVNRERKEYLQKIQRGELDDFSKQKLQQMDLIYRISNTTIEKYIKIYDQLKKSADSVIPFNQITELEKIHKLQAIFQVYQRSLEDSDPFKKFMILLKNISSQVNQASDKNINALYRQLDEILNQKHAILTSPIKIQGQQTEQTIYGKDIKYKSPFSDEQQEEILFSDDSDEEQQLTSKIQKPQKQSSKQNNFISANQTDDFVNRFREFYIKFEDTLRDGREFWTLFLFDLIQEVVTDKSDNELWNHLYSMINNEDAATYLITYRNEIKIYLDAIDFFQKSDKNQDKQRLKQMQKELIKPSNFQIKGIIQISFY